MVADNDAIALLEERASSYLLFSALFYREATRELFEQLLEGSEETGLLKGYVDSVEGKDAQELFASSKSEFAALFLGMSAKPVFTSESVYLSENHCLMQEQRDEVLALYRSAGFVPDASFREPEDHIAVELSFMAQLCALALENVKEGDADAAEEYADRQKEFFESHLGKWTFEFCAAVRQNNRANFYRAVADLFEEFMKTEQEYFASLVD